jgi:hypothetical protein
MDSPNDSRVVAKAQVLEAWTYGLGQASMLLDSHLTQRVHAH